MDSACRDDFEDPRHREPLHVAMAVAAFVITIAGATTATGCRRATNPQDEQPAAREETRYADFSGTIPMAWDCREPFAIDGCEPAHGFLVVEKVKDHPSIVGSGVEAGDICLSWGTRLPEPPKTLRDAFLAYLCNDADDGDLCWFAHNRDGKIEVFSCLMGELYECMASPGTFGLELRPVAFADEEVERIMSEWFSMSM